MTIPSFTAAQLRAMRWLPADGSWRTEAGREFSAAAESLCFYVRDLVERERGTFDKHAQPNPRSAMRVRYRLTPVGIAMRQELAHAGKLAEQEKR